MRKLAIAVALSTTVLAGPALARDGAWYVGGDFGAMVVEDTDTVFTPGSTATNTGLIQIGFDEGFDGSLFAGYDLGAFRIEAEVSYKQADQEELLTTGITVPGTASIANQFNGGDGDIAVLAGMINGMLDFGDDDGLTGFVGGGVGIARVDFNNFAAFTNTGVIIDDSDTRFAWQLIAGVRQAISPNIDLHLKYRFFNVDELELTGFGGRVVEADLRTHSVLGGITFNFGGRPVEPECLAPNVLNEAGDCETPTPPPLPDCGVGERRSADGVSCETIPEDTQVCQNGVRIPVGQQCPAVILPPAIVYFGWDQDELTAEARGILDGVITNYRNGGSATQVVLAGHADTSGASSYNVRLSQRRADNVRAYLTAGGIPEGQMTAQAFGESRPVVAVGQDGVREPQNRRVEITFGPGSGW